MALINCPECKNTISSVAVSCPHCGMPLVCPECGRKHPPLEERLPPKPRQKSLRWAPLGLALVAVPLLAWGLIWSISRTETPAPRRHAAPSAAAPALAEQTILRLAGSGEQGLRLAAALAEAFLKRGAGEVWGTPQPAPGGVAIQGRFPAEHAIKKIEISMQDRESVLLNLASEQLDLGLTAKPGPEGYANSRHPEPVAPVFEEHALAADGLAVIVGRDNPVPVLSKDQIAAIFGGIIGDWRQVKQKPGPIKVYVPEEGTESGAAFRALLPGALPERAVAYPEPGRIAEAVAQDPAGIGVVPLAHIGQAKAVPITEIPTEPILPTATNVALGVYPLSSRLYLYHLKGHDNPAVKEFAAFAASPAGQAVVRRSGLVALGVSAKAAGAGADEYAWLTADALHLSFDLQFRSGSGELDAAARTKLLRAADFLNEIGPENYTLLVLGFSDSEGNPASHPRVSLRRAQRVAEDLKRQGIVPAVVRGMGSARPVAGNDTEEGRNRNRRVELWLKRENRSVAETQPRQP